MCGKRRAHASFPTKEPLLTGLFCGKPAENVHDTYFALAFPSVVSENVLATKKGESKKKRGKYLGAVPAERNASLQCAVARNRWLS